MKEAGEHGVSRHGGSTSGCQTDLTNHINSDVERKSFFFYLSDGRQQPWPIRRSRLAVALGQTRQRLSLLA
jgi:hypothetical protein